MAERPEPLEIEVKLRASSKAVLDAIWGQSRFGPFVLRRRRIERQTNRYYEREDGKPLDAASLRWRLIDGGRTGTLTLKLPGTRSDGLVERPEIAVELPADADPLQVHPVPAPLEQLYLQLGPVRLRPAFETRTERRIMEVETDSAAIELALDVVHLVGDPDFVLCEVEAELKRGPRDALVRMAEQLDGISGLVRESRSKHEQILARVATRKRSAS